jgi:serine/threonine protein kinase
MLDVRRPAYGHDDGDEPSDGVLPMSVGLDMRARARLGTTLRGKYTLERILGAGGMAIVYKAVHRNRAEFAVKMLLPELSHDEEVRTRFLREGYAANSVKHPGVVAIVDDDVAEDGSAFIVMELLDGLSAEELAQKHGMRVPPKIAAAIGCQLLDVIAAAHQKGILHRDIKPANLFVTRTGQVKVLDFGIARVRDLASKGAHATQTGTSFGTPAFMSPEQARGKTKEVDERSDVWATGATLFAMITGSVVHDGESSNEIMVKAATEPARRIAALAPEVPPLVAAVIDRALAFTPQQRWATAAGMRDALVAAYTQCFGAPANAELAAFLDATPEITQVGPMGATRRLEGDGGTTVVPVATDSAKTRHRGVLVAVISGGTILLAGLAFLGAYVKLTSARTTTSTSTPTITIASEPTATQTPTPTLPPTETPTPALTQTLPPTPTVTITTVHKPTPKPSATAAKPECNPRYTLDKDGNKHFKAGVLLMRLAAFAFVTSVAGVALADATPQECIAHNEKSIQLRGEHKLQASRDELLQCTQPACPGEIRGECERRLVVVNAEIPSVVISAKDPSGGDLIDVRVSIDGTRDIPKLDGAPITLDPGPHLFRFETARARTEARVLIREGEKDRPIRVTLGEATPPPGPSVGATHKNPAFRVAGASIAGVGLAGVILGAVFGGLASSSWSRSQTECRTVADCTNRSAALADHDDAMTFATISTIGLVAGGIAIMAGATIFFLAPSVTRESAMLSVAARF